MRGLRLRQVLALLTGKSRRKRLLRSRTPSSRQPPLAAAAPAVLRTKSYISSSTNFSPNLSINNFTKLDKNVNTNVDDSKGYIYIIISIVVILIVIGIFLIIKKKNNIGNDSKFEINENFDSQYMEPTVLKDELYEPINNYETII